MSYFCYFGPLNLSKLRIKIHVFVCAYKHACMHVCGCLDAFVHTYVCLGVGELCPSSSSWDTSTYIG